MLKSLTRHLKSSTFLLATVYATLFGISTIGLMAFIYWSSFQSTLKQVDSVIEEDLSGLLKYSSNPWQIMPFANLGQAVMGRTNYRMPSDPSIYLFANLNGERIAGNIERMPPKIIGFVGWVVFPLKGFGTNKDETHLIRALVVPVGDRLQLLVGRDIQFLENLKDKYFAILLWGAGITIILAIIGALLFSKIVARRLETINSTCRIVMAGDLTQRIHSDQSGDGFDKLCLNFNEMLERVESLMYDIKQVSDNIAHDLRTPLTRLKHQLELALEYSRNPNKQGTDYQGMIEQSIYEADSLLSTCSALLRIASIETKSVSHSFSNFELRKLIEDAVELYGPIVEEKSISIKIESIDSNINLLADRDLVFQALVNLIDNAIKYTPDQGEICLSTSESDDRIEIVVADSGPGIPSEFHEKVFQRLYRMESSRSTPGNGLGLSLVSAVAGIHDAELKLEDNHPGLKVRMIFKKSSEESGAHG